MTMHGTNPATVESVKREAKRIARATSISHSQALDVLSVQAGHTHWGAYQNALRQNPNTNPDRITDVPAQGGMVSQMIAGLWPDDDGFRNVTSGCRHLVVSGTTSTGKTTLMQRLLGEASPRARIIYIQDGPGDPRILSNCTILSVEHGSMPFHAQDWAKTWRDAISEGPDAVVIADVNVHNAALISEAMADPTIPPLFTTVHAESCEQAAERLGRRGGRTVRDGGGGVVCFQISRNRHGQRVITDVARI